uniref:Uncharacterized protein n=1 Tax=viral metagenome TaxID=1070528 RepID=A0A6C0ADL0_9ZZZZ
MSFYNFSGTYIVQIGGYNANANLVFTVDNNNLVTALSGSIEYYINLNLFYTDTNPQLLPPGSFENNDNILNSTDNIPYFSTNGLSLLSTFGFNVNYNFRNISGIDNSYNSFGLENYPFTSESLFLPCLLSNTNILTKNGYIKIDSLKNEDIILSENKEFKIKNIFNTDIKLIDKYMPFLLPKDFLNSKEDLYLSQGHAIKVEDKFFLPEHLGLKRLSIEEFIKLNENKYYHIELYCEENENRRTNTLDANGVTVESYSSQEIPW